jgi:hypothetical protein
MCVELVSTVATFFIARLAVVFNDESVRLPVVLAEPSGARDPFVMTCLMTISNYMDHVI